MRRWGTFRMGRFAVLAACTMSAVWAPAARPGVKTPGPVSVSQRGDSFALENAVISAHWSVANGSLSGLVIRDQMHGRDIRVNEPFRILLSNGAILDERNLKLVGNAKVTHLTPTPTAPRMAATIPGAMVD